MSCIFKKFNFSGTSSYFRLPFHPNENTSMRAVAKMLRARASEHLCIFCEQVEQRPNFASTFNRMGPFDTPIVELASSINLPLTKVHSLLLELEIKTNKTYKSRSKLGCNENLRPLELFFLKKIYIVNSSLCSYHGLCYGHGMFTQQPERSEIFRPSP